MSPSAVNAGLEELVGESGRFLFAHCDSNSPAARALAARPKLKV